MFSRIRSVSSTVVSLCASVSHTVSFCRGYALRHATLQWDLMDRHASCGGGFASIVVCVTVASFCAWFAGELWFVLCLRRIRKTELDLRSDWTAFEVVLTFLNF